jgi:hypothetical protein
LSSADAPKRKKKRGPRHDGGGDGARRQAVALLTRRLSHPDAGTFEEVEDEVNKDDDVFLLVWMNTKETKKDVMKTVRRMII